MSAIMSIVKYIFSIIGAGMLVGTFFWFQHVESFIAESAKAEGKVTEVVRSRSSDSTTYKPVVQFNAPNGELIEFMSDTGSNPPSHTVGEKVEVLYLPDNPHDAKINSFFTLWFGPLIVGVMGGIFFLVGLGIVLATANKSRKYVHLRKNGTPVITKFQEVERIRSHRAKGRSPYRIISQWQDPVTSEIYVFNSDYIWFDPVDYIKGKDITVFLDKKNRKKYYMDLSFLPKSAN